MRFIWAPRPNSFSSPATPTPLPPSRRASKPKSRATTRFCPPKRCTGGPERRFCTSKRCTEGAGARFCMSKRRTEGAGRRFCTSKRSTEEAGRRFCTSKRYPEGAGRRFCTSKRRTEGAGARFGSPKCLIGRGRGGWVVWLRGLVGEGRLQVEHSPVWVGPRQPSERS